VEKLSKGMSVLNIFAYTGGFSVYAARGGAREVISVDLSAPALEGAMRNMKHNELDVPHKVIAQDAFVFLEEMASQKRLFDVVIIDPPMFAQNQAQIDVALSAYRRLTRLGLSVLRPRGTLVQASCSSRVDAESFFNCIHQGAKDADRRLTEIERTGHALDHPVRFKEGAYLKCLFAAVN
jgi:23S rRNA (cytosine1962-C5)-methyltransferase